MLEESNLNNFFVNTGIRWRLVNSHTVITVVVSIEFSPMLREVPEGMHYQGARQSSMHEC